MSPFTQIFLILFRIATDMYSQYTCMFILRNEKKMIPSVILIITSLYDQDWTWKYYQRLNFGCGLPPNLSVYRPWTSLG